LNHSNFQLVRYESDGVHFEEILSYSSSDPSQTQQGEIEELLYRYYQHQDPIWNYAEPNPEKRSKVVSSFESPELIIHSSPIFSFQHGQAFCSRHPKYMGFGMEIILVAS
jgi:hypothetical protein